MKPTSPEKSRSSLRICVCGCGLSFSANSTSRKIYINRRHKENAKNLRKKLEEPEGET